MKNDFLVSVRCISYNHASYIKDCMNGFTMQETKFPYVCVIDDDASTDGEPEVITNYMAEHFNIDDKDVVRSEETDDYRMIFAQHKTNKNCFFAVFFLKYNHYSIGKSRESYVARFVDGTKYMAICEGDDYWIDQLKLQKQVDALENHSDCLISYCRVQRIRKDGSVLKNKTIPFKGVFSEGVVTLEDFCKEEFYNGRWCFHTSCFFIRSEYIKRSDERDKLFTVFPYGDMPTQLWCLLHGNGYFINEICSCYRVLSGGYNSCLRKDIDFAISQNKKLIMALNYLNDYTSGRYSNAIRRRILRAEFKNAEIEGDRFVLYNHKYWPLLTHYSLKGHISYIMKNLFPSLHSYIKYNLLKRNV